MAKRASQKTVQKRAREHFDVLEEGIMHTRHDRPVLAQRYLDLARRISRKLRVRVPRPIRRQYCTYCKSLLVPGKTSRTRLKNGKLVVYCSKCRNYDRFVYK